MSDKLDIHTPRGQQAHRAAQYMAARLGDKWGMRWFATPSAEGKANARLDGMFVRYHPASEVTIVAECKVRSQSRAFFDTVSEFPGHYIISENKITHGLAASRTFGVPFFICAYLVPDMAAHVFPISNHAGELLLEYQRARTATRRTVNGGVAIGDNAYIPFAYAHVYDLQSETAQDIAATYLKGNAA